MKAKKFVALAMSVAMAVGASSLLAACNTGDEGDNGTGGYAEDTRIWYAVGQDTKGTLKDHPWEPFNTTYRFERDTTVTDENVFTLTLEIYAGDVGEGNSFKFLYMNSEDEDISESGLWARQVGIHAFEGMDGYEGEGLDSVIKIDGETVFTTAQDNGDDGTNMACAKGQDGKYKFTLRTQNGTDTPKLSVERVEKIVVPYDMYIRGDMNFFRLTDMTAMTETIGTGSAHTTWSVDLEVSAKDLWRTLDGAEVEADEKGNPIGGTHTAIQIYNDIDAKAYTLAEGDDSYTVIDDIEFVNKRYGKSILLPEGDYTITFDTVTKDVSIVKYVHKMYFTGEFNNNALGDANYKLTKGDGIWSGYLTIDEDAANPEKQTAVKLYDSVTKTTSEAYNLTAGTYAFKYTEATEKIEYEEVAYWLVGSFVDSRTNQNVNFAISEGITPKFEKGEGGAYTATIKAEDVTSRQGYEWIKTDGGNTNNGVFAVQVVYGTKLLGVKDWNSSGANQYLPAGVWEVTFGGSGPVTWAEGDEENVPTPPALQYEMYLTGSFNSWEKGDADYAMKYNSNEGAWVGYLNVTEATELKLYNKTTGDHFSTPELGEGNISITTPGYYMFVFVEDGSVVKYDVVDFYVIGSFFNADGTQLSFDVADGITPKFVAGANANELTVTYEVTDTTAVAANAYNFNGWGAGSENAIFVWKPVATCSLAQYSGNYAGTKMWDLTPSANNFLSEAGTYTFTYNIVTKALSATLNSATAPEAPEVTPEA